MIYLWWFILVAFVAVELTILLIVGTIIHDLITKVGISTWVDLIVWIFAIPICGIFILLAVANIFY